MGGAEVKIGRSTKRFVDFIVCGAMVVLEVVSTNIFRENHCLFETLLVDVHLRRRSCLVSRKGHSFLQYM